MSDELLGAFASALLAGTIRVIDLTQTLQAMAPASVLPPSHPPTDPTSPGDPQGAAWAWNNISMGEQAGTHLDAPSHDPDEGPSDGFTDTIPVQRFVAPAIVIDCSVEAAADDRFMLRPEHIEAWEAEHGQIPAGAWVLMRTDWSKRTDPAAFLNVQPDGSHTPGPSAEAMRVLVEERDVNGWGVETVGPDHGLASSFSPPFPAQAMLHGANKLGLAGLCNLDLLPPRGAILVTAPLKIDRGAGSPLRVLALVAA